MSIGEAIEKTFPNLKLLVRKFPDSASRVLSGPALETNSSRIDRGILQENEQMVEENEVMVHSNLLCSYTESSMRWLRCLLISIEGTRGPLTLRRSRKRMRR